MVKSIVVVSILAFSVAWAAVAVDAVQPNLPGLLSWKELDSIPDDVGFAAPFAGVSGDVLIVAGGANFPDAPPWENGEKVWHDRIFALTSPGGSWRQLDERLPRPNAYGVSISTEAGILCIGGCDAQQCFDDVLLLKWDRDRQRVVLSDKYVAGKDDKANIAPLPKLPVPLAFMGGAMIGDTIYLVGGQQEMRQPQAVTSFFTLDLSQRTDADKFQWQNMPIGRGMSPRVLPVCAAQSDGRDTCFYVFSGRDAPGEGAELLTDAWKFSPKAYRYSAAHPGNGNLHNAWTRLLDTPRCLMAGTAVAVGAGQILTFGGDDGKHFGENLREEHPGFPGDMVYLYDCVTDRWSQRGEMPVNLVTTTAVRWNEQIVIPGGELKPGIRSTQVLAAELVHSKRVFAPADWVVMGIYVVVLVGVGFYFARRENTTDDFFLAGRRVPWWAAGLSIFATMLSAITYLSIPSKSFHTDWAWFLVNMGILAVAPLVAFVYLPFFRRLNVTTAYEYLEARFSLGIRLFGSLSFIVFQIGRMGIVVFLPAIALSAVTGINVFVCIIAMGVLSTIYTVLGGIEAVIWTDVLQAVVLLSGALAAVLIVAGSLDGGLATIVTQGAAAGKLNMVHLSWDWTGDALIVIVLGALFTNLVPYTSDQAVVQRYLTTKDEKRARGAIWTNAFFSLLATVLFFGVGTALFVFYRTFPERMVPLANQDQIFAWFIAREMPVGLSGLVIAGVFAASMSSLDSSMHSISTAITTDFVRRFWPDQKEHAFLVIARWLTVLLGVAGTASAIVLALMEDRNLWDRFMGYMGLVGGTLAGLFALGVFTRRVYQVHAWIGAAASIAVLVYVQTNLKLAGLLNAAIAICTCFAVAWLASLVVPAAAKNTTGLTIFSLGKSAGERGASAP